MKRKGDLTGSAWKIKRQEGNSWDLPCGWRERDQSVRGMFKATLLSLHLLTTGSSTPGCKDACLFIHSVSCQQMVCLLLTGPCANYCLRCNSEANVLFPALQQNLREYGGYPAEPVPKLVVIKVGQH